MEMDRSGDMKKTLDKNPESSECAPHSPVACCGAPYLPTCVDLDFAVEEDFVPHVQ